MGSGIHEMKKSNLVADLVQGRMRTTTGHPCSTSVKPAAPINLGSPAFTWNGHMYHRIEFSNEENRPIEDRAEVIFGTIQLATLENRYYWHCWQHVDITNGF